ncbi:MAG TPA: cytochrome c [Gemmatimonadaceae bacterium]|nr:cytochrome c [Gemmatimonadaceae bacterium]
MSAKIEGRGTGDAGRVSRFVHAFVPRPVSHVPTRALLAVLPLALSACSWFTDFKQQPKVDPWESVADSIATRGNPQNSVPITGTAVAGFQVSRQQLPATIDSMSSLRNPTPVSDASLMNGRKYFQINCAVCHGDQGMGNGLATHYGMPGISIGVGSPAANTRTDGYIFGMIRNGRGLMPTYDRIEEMDRWDVVNYIRALQGKVPNTAGVGPVGYPGQTGDALPGYSQTGPQRPSPYLKPSRASSAEASAGAAATTAAPARDSAAAGATQPAAAPGAAHPTTDTAAARNRGGAQ